MKKGRGVTALVAVLLTALLLGGCGAVSALLNTRQALQNAGYQDVSVNISSSSSSGDDDLSVKVSVQAAASDDAASNVAQIVWQQFHERFDYLNVTVDGVGGADVQQSYSFGQVQEAFGPRNPAWNKTTIGSDAIRGVVYVVVGLVTVAVLVLVIVLATRRGRRRPPGPGGWPGPPGGPGGPRVWFPPGAGPAPGSWPAQYPPGPPVWQPQPPPPGQPGWQTQPPPPGQYPPGPSR